MTMRFDTPAMSSNVTSATGRNSLSSCDIFIRNHDVAVNKLNQKQNDTKCSRGTSAQMCSRVVRSAGIQKSIEQVSSFVAAQRPPPPPPPFVKPFTFFESTHLFSTNNLSTWWDASAASYPARHENNILYKPSWLHTVTHRAVSESSDGTENNHSLNFILVTCFSGNQFLWVHQAWSG